MSSTLPPGPTSAHWPLSEHRVVLPRCVLDMEHRLALREGEPVPVEPRAWRVLEPLVRFRHRVVTKEELLVALRPGGRASEGALKQAIRLARQAIGDEGPQPVIRSIPRVGYLLDVVAPHIEPAPESSRNASGRRRIVVGTVRHPTAISELSWVKFGLAACLSHLLGFDRRLSMDAEPQELSIDKWLPLSGQDLQQLLRASDADVAMSGLLEVGEGVLRLTLTLVRQGQRQPDTLSIEAPTAAGLVLPALEALRSSLGLEDPAASGTEDLCRLSDESFELFGRAMQAAADYRAASVVKLLRLLKAVEPGFPNVDLEILRAQAACGDTDGIQLGEALMERGRIAQDAVLQAQACRALARLRAMQGDYQQAVVTYQQALQLGSGVLPDVWCGHVLFSCASSAHASGQRHMAEVYADRARAISVATGDKHLMIRVLALRAVDSSLSGQLDRAIRLNERVAKTARRIRSGHIQFVACVNLAGDFSWLDRLEWSERYAQEALALALMAKNESYIGYAANVLCMALRFRQRAADAAIVLRDLPQPREIVDRAYLWQAHGHAAMAAGRFDAAADAFIEAATEFRRRGHLIAEAPLQPWLVEALVRCGRLRAAEAELELAALRPHLQDDLTVSHLLYPRALLYRALNRQADAAQVLARMDQSPTASPLFRRLARELSRRPVDDPGAPPQFASSGGFLRRQHRFGHCLMDIERRELRVEGRPRALAPKPFGVLVHLYRNRHRIVSREELLDTLWPEGGGSLESVAQAITAIRQATRPANGNSVELIRTFYGQGYRLQVEDVSAVDDEVSDALLKLVESEDAPPLVIVPQAHDACDGAGGASMSHAMSLLCHSMALHARMTPVVLPELAELQTQHPGHTHDMLIEAVRRQHPQAAVARLSLSAGADEWRLAYAVESPLGQQGGSLVAPRPTQLGELAARRLGLGLSVPAPAGRESATGDAWGLHWLERAVQAADAGQLDHALQIVDAVLSEEPAHRLAARWREQWISQARAV